MATVSFPSPDWLKNVHEEESSLHHLFYKGRRHKHTPHVIGALARLGASEDQVKAYVKEYYPVIPIYNKDEALTEILEIDSTKSNNLRDYRGKNNGVYKMKELYEELLATKYNGDMLAMIKDVCPDIIDGPLYSAFHGLIAMAYGYVGKSDSVMLEGLIFMDHGYSPLIPPAHPKHRDMSVFGTGKTDILDVLQKLHNNQELVKQVKEELRDTDEREFANSVYGWSLVQYHGEYITDLTDEICLPEWFDHSKEDMQQILRLIDWVFDMACVVYVKNEHKNDFFLLHGITASWSAKQIFPLFDYKTALLGVRALISAVLAVYVYQDAPALTSTTDDVFKGDVTDELWDSCINETLTGKTYEPHVYKVIQVCYENWKERPNSRYASYYYAAVLLVKKHPYHFDLNREPMVNDDILK